MLAKSVNSFFIRVFSYYKVKHLENVGKGGIGKSGWEELNQKIGKEKKPQPRKTNLIKSQNKNRAPW